MPERRRHPRFTALLPLRLKIVGGIVEPNPAPLVTQNLSKTGLCFPSPQRIEPGQSIEVEVTFLGAGLGGNNICVSSTGYIVRAESTKNAGLVQTGRYIRRITFRRQTGLAKISCGVR